MIVLDDLVQAATHLTAFVTDHVVIPLLILFVGLLLGRTVYNFLLKITKAIELDIHIRKTLSLEVRVGEFISALVAITIYIFAITWALHQAGILIQTVQVLGIIFGILILVGIIAWLQDLIPDAVHSIFVRKQLQKGDMYKGEVSGIVRSIRWLRIIIEKDGVYYSVPHRTVAKQMHAKS